MAKKLRQPKLSKAKYNPELSKQFSKLAKAKVQECFENCFRVMLHHHQPNMMYVEGVVLIDPKLPVPQHHAWIEWRGKIVDPTRPKTEKAAKKFLAKLPDWQYHGVVRLNRAAFWDVITKDEASAWDFDQWFLSGLEKRTAKKRKNRGPRSRTT